MKIQKVEYIEAVRPIKVMDCYVGDGYVKKAHGSLPDIDTDFSSEQRPLVKEYLEHRYNKGVSQRVFSAGTFTTEKARSVIKDVARTHKLSVATTNYITAIIESESNWTDIMVTAFKEKKVYDFIQKNWQVFEEIHSIMGQPRSAGIHASAYVICPNVIKGKQVECFDIIPMRKMDGQLVSELSGTDIDELGLLKNDVLGIAELARLYDMIAICNKEYDANISLDSIVDGDLEDKRVYEIIQKGYTQGIFQLSGDGITRYIKQMKPDNIHDLIHSIALFRPGPLESGTAQAYIDCKRGDAEPYYLWGTEDILKSTYGLCCIAEHSLIKTRNGLKPIQDVGIGDFVQTESGAYRKVLDKMYKGRKRILKIRTTHGLELRCTSDHKVLTQYGWVLAGDLQKSKHLIKGQWLTDEKLPKGDMKDWCVGLYMANGFWGTTPAITCRNQDDAYIIADIFKQAFDLNCHIYFNVRAWYVSLSYRKNNKKSNPFKEHLRTIGLANKKSADKNIGLMPLMAISGFYEGDGCTANRRMRIKNKILAHNILYSLQAFHIHSYLYETIEDEDVVYNIAVVDDSKLCNYIKQQRYVKNENRAGCFVPSDYMKSIDMRALNYVDRKRVNQFILHSSYIHKNCAIKYGAMIPHDVWGKILSIEDDGYDITYDLSVEKEHSFTTGGLVTHNCYQEQIAKVAQKIGNLSLGDGVNLVKALSKKKIEKVRKFKDRYFEGAKKNGCPKEAAERIWEIVEAGAKYAFNVSHSTAYGLTAYAGAWVKVHYPVAFFTVLLKWVDKEKLPTLMNEMREIGNATIVQPDINISGIDFVTDFKTNEIYWSLSRIRNIGAAQAKYIFKDRTMFGEYKSLEHFVKRIFRNKFVDETLEELPESAPNGRCPVTSLSVKHLILSGAFDKLEGISSVMERYGLIKKLAEMLKLKQEDIDVQFPEDLVGKHYFWSQKQIDISGFGSIDYRRIYDNIEKTKLPKKYRYCDLKEFNAEIPEKFSAVICATIAEVSEKTYKDKRTGETKHFGKVMLQQNTDMVQLVVWNDAWVDCKMRFKDKKGSVVIAAVQVKYSDYDEKNIVQINKGAFVENV